MSLKSRRELLAGGLGVGAATAVLGAKDAAGAGRSAASQLADRQRDLQVLEDLQNGERLLQYCFTRVLESGALKHASTEVVLVAYGHEQEHASAIQAGIDLVRGQIAGLELGLPVARHPVSPPRHPKHPEPFPPPQIVSLFARLNHEPYCVIQLSKVELFVQSKYFSAVGTLSAPGLVRTAAQILGCKAQQWSLYWNLLSHGKVLATVPSPEVRGSATLPK